MSACNSNILASASVSGGILFFVSNHCIIVAAMRIGCQEKLADGLDIITVICLQYAMCKAEEGNDA